MVDFSRGGCLLVTNQITKKILHSNVLVLFTHLVCVEMF